MRREDVTMHELDDERPIPLGRAAAASTAAFVPAPLAPVTEPAAPAPRPATHIERTRPPADGPSVPPADIAAPGTVAVVEQPAAPPPAAATPAEAGPAPIRAPAEHPLAALRGFRMEVAVVGRRRARGWVRDVGCFLAAWVVVVAFVLALIAAFNALTTQLGSAHP
jgi:hypothetical protein